MNPKDIPAFPTPSGWNHEGKWVQDSCDFNGMTLRDYFAAKAMSEMTWQTKSGSARECYEIADAMMEARK